MAPTQADTAPERKASHAPGTRRGPNLPLVIVGGLGLLGFALAAGWLAFNALFRPAETTALPALAAATEVEPTAAAATAVAVATARPTVAPPTAAPTATVASSDTPAPTATPTIASATATTSPTTTDSIAGNWIGTLTSSDGSFSARLELSIQAGCLVGKVCGTYTFVEQSATNSATCPSGGFEYVQLQSDGTLSWQYLNGAAQSSATLRQP